MEAVEEMPHTDGKTSTFIDEMGHRWRGPSSGKYGKKSEEKTFEKGYDKA